ncbi:MAG: hypothetical protein PWQ18_99 [Clostridia bacterium]|nr:hypothetical protein [Clostridia bacterium]
MPKQKLNLPEIEVKQRLNLSDHVYKALKDAILSGKISQGSRLVEEQLARTLKVSKTPLREALGALEKEGLVEAIPYQGRYVASVAPCQMLEVYEVREMLEGLAARLAAEQASPELCSDLQKCLERSKDALEREDIDEFLRNDREFHGLLIECAKNKTLEQMNQLIRSRIMLGQVTSAYRLHRRDASLSEHQAVLRAIIDRDPEAAEVAMRRHIKNLAATLACTGCQNHTDCVYRNKIGFDPHKCEYCRFYNPVKKVE